MDGEGVVMGQGNSLMLQHFNINVVGHIYETAITFTCVHVYITDDLLMSLDLPSDLLRATQRGTTTTQKHTVVCSCRHYRHGNPSTIVDEGCINMNLLHRGRATRV